MRLDILTTGILAATLGLGACSKSNSQGTNPPVTPPDLTIMFGDDGGGGDDGGPGTDDAGGPPNNCGDNDPACRDVATGPPNGTFPLQGDPMKSPGEKDTGVNRDPNGYLGLDSTHSVFNYLWIANSDEGTASKIDSKTVREVARYVSATCYSFAPPLGGVQACDGKNGCCAIDDDPRWQARKIKGAQPGHQQVQTTSNSPSRTAVDFNGDLFLSNRAFSGQSSVTKVANDLAECIDRNKNGKIDTSSDTNADGTIQTDCNGNGTPDDIADVKMSPCGNGLKQEFYGQDDECVLWTSNTFVRDTWGRPLGLAAGANDSAVSDAWAGGYNNGIFVRIDGTTGLAKDDVKLPGSCQPYGLAVDSTGYGWAPNLGGGPLCFFDTKNTKNGGGTARDPQFGQMEGYGITLDRDQNVWVGMGVERYAPDRSNGFKSLGNGFWTKISGANGIGIAADSRNAKAYFVYSCTGQDVLQIPASTIPLAKMDQQVNPNGWTTINMPCYGVGVDTDQNVWGVDMSIATRATLDKNGMVTQPKINTPPMGNNLCPAGDQCPMNGGPYTYSDFTGFGLRNFTRPSGSYTLVIPGCVDTNGAPVDTEWNAVVWDAIVPPNTTLTVHARAGNTPLPDMTWGMPTSEGMTSPLQLLPMNGGALVPNLIDGKDAFLEVQFTFKTSALNASPKLKSIDVAFKCKTIM